MSSEAPESQPTDLKGCPADLAEMREPVSDQTPPPDHQQQAAALSDEAVTAFLTERPQFVQQWLRQRGGSALGTVAPPVVLRSRNSITDDLFRDLLEQRRGSPTPVTSSVTPSSAALDENELMIELIRDIANEFDIHLLCRKIMKNVGVLTHADRGSLFLAKGSRGHRYLVANVFDVMGDEEGAGNMQLKAAGEIRIPFGLGIAGYVAQTKEIVNLADAYLDPHFSPEVDEMTGYKTGSLLCMPICNHADEVIGVAQIINKQGAECSAFTEADVQIFQKYLVFCGIGLQNAQLFDLSISEFKKNQILLNLARGIFVEQYSLENLVKKIMREATDLLHCEQAVVFLRDDHHDSTATGSEFGLPPVRSSDQLSSSLPVTRTTSRESGTTEQAATFVQCFSLTTDSGGEQNVRSLPEVEFRQLPLHDVALRVLETGETMATSDGDEDGETVGIRWHHDDRSSKMRSVLTIPIHNQSHTIIGVAHFINKENGYCFTDQDIRAVETFGVFCGLGIHNSQMYENACRLMAKQRVALECLSYHATASAESTAELVSRHVPSALQLNLYSHQFDDMELDNKDTCTAAIRMFKDMNMIKKFRIPYEVLCRWILSVQKNYRPVKYHNWRHALNVTQTMFALLRTGKMAGFISDQEVLGLMVACLSHDLDHRGTNNAFQSKTDSPLAMLYSTSTMEHHHFDQCVMILNSEGNNIFQVLKPEDYRQVMDTVQQAILSTDLEQYFKTKPQFLQVVRNGQPDWHEPHNKK
ncbi:cGMP-specific 3',5'-cyclic phosphodiesterase-like, partial [Amphibalanus amphitrite]|uniref:cGMP-specific 3',5'-cyclic phosphodiesterase-like n=1 Tax=Amphibalanus amphitrite TaxID=1232801 RepID=UPI001C90E8FE